MLRRLSGMSGARACGMCAALPTATAVMTPGAAFASRVPPPSASSTMSPCSLSTSPAQQVARRWFAPSVATLIRAAGHSSPSVQRTNTEVNWGSGGSGGGSTADSLTPYVRQHLTRVYSLLALGCISAGCGSALMFATALGKMIPFWLPMVAGFVPLLWLSFAPPKDPNLRLALFFAFTTLEGMAIAPLVYASMAKGVLGTALVLTAAVFCGFSAAAYLAPRASLLAFQGPLFGLLIGMVAISVLNLFYPTAFAHSLVLYGGLALFSAFVAVDTQAMIERARCGAGDHVQDAMQLFLSVLNIFVRIAQILGGMDK